MALALVVGFGLSVASASAAPLPAGVLDGAVAGGARMLLAHGFHCERLWGPTPFGMSMHNNPEACGEVYYDEPYYDDGYYDDDPGIGVDIYIGSGPRHGGHFGHRKRYRRDGREVGDHGGH